MRMLQRTGGVTRRPLTGTKAALLCEFPFVLACVRVGGRGRDHPPLRRRCDTRSTKPRPGALITREGSDEEEEEVEYEEVEVDA